MKRIALIISVIIVVLFAGCQKQLQIENTNKKTIITSSGQSLNFPVFEKEIIKQKTFQALDYFSGKACSANIVELYNDYMLNENITAGDCNKDLIEKFTELYLQINNSDDLYNFLIEREVISKEAYNLINQMNKEIELESSKYEQIVDNYLILIADNKNINDIDAQKLKTSLFIYKYTMEYFENENVKGVCSTCIKANRSNISTGLVACSLASICICANFGNPAAIIACFVGLNGVLSYKVICNYCKNQCNFCF